MCLVSKSHRPEGRIFDPELREMEAPLTVGALQEVSNAGQLSLDVVPAGKQAANPEINLQLKRSISFLNAENI